ncbi:MAG: sugar ABC transporter permease [Chloroflexi bacterium]|nr:sugar ABC transporter permease [Chloroflexota bacterium]
MSEVKSAAVGAAQSTQKEGYWTVRVYRERALRLLVIAIALIYALFPVAFIISSSFNPSGSILGQGLIPNNPSLVHYNELLNSALFPFPLWVWNSVKISTITAFLAVMIGALSAYSFSRFRFSGRRALLLTIFLIQVFPNILAIVAIYLLLQTIGEIIPAFGLRTHAGLITVYLGGALGVNTWLMKGFFDTIPRELDESAMIDGASNWQIFWVIIFPLVRPVLAVVGILSFVGTYGDFILPLVLLIGEPDQYTLALGLSIVLGDQFSQNWGLFAAGALLGAAPIVVMYIAMQDYIVGGLTQGAVKG